MLLERLKDWMNRLGDTGKDVLDNMDINIVLDNLHKEMPKDDVSLQSTGALLLLLLEIILS